MPAKSPVIVIVLALLLLLGGTGVYFHSPGSHAVITMEGEQKLKVTYLFDQMESTRCRSMVDTVVTVLRASCGNCQVIKQVCQKELLEEERALLRDSKVNRPSIWINKGVISFDASDSSLALSTCQEAEKQSQATSAPLKCVPANTVRERLEKANNGSQMSRLSIGLLVLAIAGIAAFAINALIVRYQDLHARWSTDHIDGGPQKFHAQPTPRVGGIGVMGGLLISAATLLALQGEVSASQFGLLLFCSLPAFGSGLAEDLFKSVGVMMRLIFSLLAAGLSIWLLDSIIPRSGVPIFDELLKWTPFAVALTLFAIAGVTNATNIIDGYNGLASGYSILALIAVGAIGYQLNDDLILVSAAAMIGAQLGFFALNYPYGRIFLGDGGAYLLGFWLAVLAILLMVRHDQVSAWAAISLVLYPVFETLFSIYRRLRRRHSPGHPDALHLHQLIFRRVIWPGTDQTQRNAGVAKYLWALSLICIIPSIFWYQSAAVLILASFTFCATYVYVYWSIVKFKKSPILGGR